MVKKKENQISVKKRLSVLLATILTVSAIMFFSIDSNMIKDRRVEMNKVKLYNEVAEQPYLVVNDKVIIDDKNDELTIEHLDNQSDQINITGSGAKNILENDTIRLYQNDVIYYYRLPSAKVHGDSDENRLIVVENEGQTTLYEYDSYKELGRLSFLERFIGAENNNGIYGVE